MAELEMVTVRLPKELVERMRVYVQQEGFLQQRYVQKALEHQLDVDYPRKSNSYFTDRDTSAVQP
jgi:hypothetical protein